MHDINFFAYKKEQKKNNSFMMFLIILLVIIILVNGVLFGGGYYLLKGIEDDIKDKQSYIDDTAIQLAIKEAEQIKMEVELTTNYLNLLNIIDNKINQVDFLDTSLLNHIRELTPADVVFTSAQIDGINVNLTCEGKVPTDPMDMYHSFRQSPRFINVIVSGITINAEFCVFTINCLVKSEEVDQP